MYLDVQELISEIPALQQADNKNLLEGVLGQIIYRVSRLFDSHTQAPMHYYGEKPSGVYGDRFYILNGTNFLHTHHFEELANVQIRNNSVNSWTRQLSKQWLEIGYLYKEPSEVVQITAQWGFKFIPEDVKEAVSYQAKIFISNAPLGRLGFDNNSISQEQADFYSTLYYSIVEKYRHLNKFAYSNASFGELNIISSFQPFVFSDDGDISYSFTQTTPNQTWTITHDLNLASDEILIELSDQSGNPILGYITYPTTNQFTVTFAYPITGSVRVG